jgi:tellurite methyltransferase
MAAADRERWNTKYREEAARPLRSEDEIATPSHFLAEVSALLPASGRGLDVAGGSGRNARWLLQRGLQVTIADISEVGLQRAVAAAPGLQTVQLDLESEPLPPGPWDLILCSHFLHRPLFAAFPGALAPGGMLIVAHPTASNLQRHPKPGRRFLLEDGELPSLISGLDILLYKEGWTPSGRHEAHLLAQKPAS